MLAVGTFCLRLAGPFFAGKLTLTTSLQSLLSEAAIVLLCALAAVSSVLDGAQFAGWARPIGVLVGIVLTLRRAPFPVIVVTSACVTAGLRYLGLS
ncbi:AzlD domain-containing protein [Rhodoferax sp.]|uniref:AzlD domain-containing protein n=1 Tax=Rhodoferax sp. TaxID=50421 RepID=UPI00386A53D5